MTKDTVKTFVGVEKLLQETIFPHLFFGNSKFLPPIIGNLITMPVKKSGLCLQDTVASANNKYLISLIERSDLIETVTG